VAPAGRTVPRFADATPGLGPRAPGVKRAMAAETLPEGSEKTELVRTMFDTIAPRYDLMNRVMTLGLDQRWRRRALDALALPPGSVVLDLACGTGDLMRLGARRGLRMLGTDLSWGMLAANRSHAARAALVQSDASALGVAPGVLDGIVCGFALRNFTDLDTALSEAERSLRPGGRIAVLEVAEPPAGLMRTGHRIWFRHVVPALGAALSDSAAYRYLPRSTAYLPSGPALRRSFVRAGFSTVGHQLLHGGLTQLVTATRAGLAP
jgi:demethylmenaquinone methyltransferase / 2-methoxy-6-polyprenyl-1,4-benzoquinol methylase